MMVRGVQSNSRFRAARNLTRLFAGSLSRKEAREVNAWNSDDNQYRSEYFAVAQLMADMEALCDDPDIIRAADEAVPPSLLARSIQYRAIMAATAAIILVVLIGFLFYDRQENSIDSNIQRYVTRIGEQRQVALADGSVIDLNTGTQLLVNMSGLERRVTLERGEAWFDIVGDPDRPFVVDTGYRTVTVLGTSFSVRKAPEFLQISVEEGVVAIHSGEELASVTAPMISDAVVSDNKAARQFRVNAGWVAEIALQKNTVKGYQPNNIKALNTWRNGLLEFAGEPLYKVVQELNRYSSKKILVEDVDIIELKIFAMFKIDRLDLALNGLQDTLNIKVTHHFDRIVLTGAE